MGIDINRLSPWAQKQIAVKLAQNVRERAQNSAETQKPKSKYHSIPTEKITAEGKQIRFDSKKESERFDELMLLLKAGVISDLKLQPQFTLQEAYTTPEGERVRAVRYNADFSYWKSGERIIEDVKSPATKTKVYAIKRKLMLEHGFKITEVE